MSLATDLLAEAQSRSFDGLTEKQLLEVVASLLFDIRAGGGKAGLSGDGPPPPSLGAEGSTYVNTANNAFYWKSSDGWHPN